jgi:predicted phage-related endonuclease
MTSVNLDSLRAQVEILRHCKQRKGELKELEDNARGAIEEAMGEADTGTLDGSVAVVWKRHKRRSVDQKALGKAHPEIVEEFRKTTEVRQFEVVEPDNE